MNIDLASNTQFGDAQGLQDFFLVHWFVHLQTATALSQKFGAQVPTYGIDSQRALDAWLELMEKKEGPMPQVLNDWLNSHAQMHTSTYALLGSTPTVAPDLSVADFTNEQSFNDWMSVHQTMHDFEYSQLGLS